MQRQLLQPSYMSLPRRTVFFNALNSLVLASVHEQLESIVHVLLPFSSLCFWTKDVINHIIYIIIQSFSLDDVTLYYN